jgi:hypothetical protein
VAVRRLANTVTFCDGHGVFFVAASGQFRTAANTSAGEDWIAPTSSLCRILRRHDRVDVRCIRSTEIGQLISHAYGDSLLDPLLDLQQPFTTCR